MIITPERENRQTETLEQTLSSRGFQQYSRMPLARKGDWLVQAAYSAPCSNTDITLRVEVSPVLGNAPENMLWFYDTPLQMYFAFELPKLADENADEIIKKLKLYRTDFQSGTLTKSLKEQGRDLFIGEDPLPGVPLIHVPITCAPVVMTRSKGLSLVTSELTSFSPSDISTILQTYVKSAQNLSDEEFLINFCSKHG